MDEALNSHPLQSMVHKLQQWKELDASEREALLALPYKIERAEPGRYIVREGDQPKHACLLISGFAFRQKIVADGSRSICSIHMRGDLIDLHNALLRTSDHNVQALTPCKLEFIPRDSIIEIAFALPNVGMAMWYDTLVDSSIFREWIANVSRRSASAAVAHLLCEFGIRLESAGLGDKLRYELPMTQEQLADCTGLTAIHVNRTLKSLEASGDITRSVRHVAIANWAKISATADFRSNYLHVPEDTLLP